MKRHMNIMNNLILVILFMTTITHSAFACKCLPTSPVEQFEQADTVMIGQMVRLVQSEDGSVNYYMYAHSYLKGKVQSRPKIYPQFVEINAGHSEESCHTVLQYQEHYLLFLNKTGDTYAINPCATNVKLSEASYVLAKLTNTNLILESSYDQYIDPEFYTPKNTRFNVNLSSEKATLVSESRYSNGDDTFTILLPDSKFKDYWANILKIEWQNTTKDDFIEWFGEPCVILDGASHNEKQALYYDMVRQKSKDHSFLNQYNNFHNLNQRPKAAGDNTHIMIYNFAKKDNPGDYFRLLVYFNRQNKVLLWRTYHNFNNMISEFSIN